MSQLKDEMEILLMYMLINNCPVMSGNMKYGIKMASKTDKETVIVIDAPSYDIAKWKKEGVIVNNGDYNYASVVNFIGAFGHRNKSTHWVNKTCLQTAYVSGASYNAEVKCDVAI